MKQTRVSRDQLGIACPTCGCRHFYTTHTEPLRDGRIRRRKVCRHCGRKVLTYESTGALLAGSEQQRNARPVSTD
jgi:transcriptional regulator NrdR family protein